MFLRIQNNGLAAPILCVLFSKAQAQQNSASAAANHHFLFS